MSIHDFVEADKVELPALSNYLDGLDSHERVQQVRSLTGAEQAKLFEAAAGLRALQLADFVPAGTPPLQEVIHLGKNSLSVFHTFEKRFCLPDDQSGVLWGYNEHPLKALAGPGYFMARPMSESEVLIDYFEVPPKKPESWPAILPNSARLGRFVYYELRDIVRGVSQHVTIGRAMRAGKYVDNWFVLCRAEPAMQ